MLKSTLELTKSPSIDTLTAPEILKLLSELL